MEISASLVGWMLGSVPLALLLGRVIGGARLISDRIEQPSARRDRAA